MTDARNGSLAAAGAAVFFGSSFVATAFALHSFGPLPIAVWRGIGASVIVGTLLVGGRHRPRVDLEAEHDDLRPTKAGRLARLAVLGFLGGPTFILGMNVAVSASGATIASFVAGLYAVVAAVLAPVVLRERLGAGAIAGFTVALLGTAMLAELDPTSSSLGGIGAGLVAAAAFGAYLVLSRRWARTVRLSGLVIAEANFVATALVLLPFAVLVPSEPLVPTVIRPDALLAIGWLVLVPSLGGQLLLLMSVRLIPARRSAAFLLVNPIVATVLAAILLGERLAPIQVVGAAFVLAGIALASGLVGSIRERVPLQANGAP
ncbi:MAG: DMT family transporter [Candidatus Limnocylindrales bacterium]